MQIRRQPTAGMKGSRVALGSLLLVGTMGLGYAQASTTVLSVEPGIVTLAMLGPIHHAEFSSPPTRLIDTRDHDDTNVSGERLKKEKPHQKKKQTDSSKKQSPGAKPRSDEPRGTEDRRDLKEDHHTLGAPAKGKTRSPDSMETSDPSSGGKENSPGSQSDDRRQGGEQSTNY
ncbi:MAG TPA: hypothetical protein PLO50_00215 [Nitrospira sp.]|nr:hypothetical protein [Nitrospira sp.]